MSVAVTCTSLEGAGGGGIRVSVPVFQLRIWVPCFDNNLKLHRSLSTRFTCFRCWKRIQRRNKLQIKFINFDSWREWFHGIWCWLLNFWSFESLPLWQTTMLSRVSYQAKANRGNQFQLSLCPEKLHILVFVSLVLGIWNQCEISMWWWPISNNLL